VFIVCAQVEAHRRDFLLQRFELTVRIDGSHDQAATTIQANDGIQCSRDSGDSSVLDVFNGPEAYTTTISDDKRNFVDKHDIHSNN
jgi:hypothetical protein